MRMPRTQYFREMVELIAKRGTCPRAQVGAVIVKDSRTLATGYNGAPSKIKHCQDTDQCTDQGCNWAVHAEANCIAFAARNGIATEGCYIYCTHMPCLGCAKLIINAGISKVFYITPYRIISGIQLLYQANVKVAFITDQNRVYEYYKLPQEHMAKDLDEKVFLNHPNELQFNGLILKRGD